VLANLGILGNGRGPVHSHCTDCGEAINRKRLEIDLAATRWIGGVP